MPRYKAGKAIQISDPAKRDLVQIGAYTQKEWGKRQKSKYLADIKAKFFDLRDNPGMGTDRRDMDEGLRPHPVGKPVIFRWNLLSDVGSKCPYIAPTGCFGKMSGKKNAAAC